jgi:hypothetical protein
MLDQCVYAVQVLFIPLRSLTDLRSTVRLDMNQGGGIGAVVGWRGYRTHKE